MVRAAGKDEDLLALAAQAGKEADTQAGISLQPIFLGPDRPGINQQGDDPGFDTRVKAPAGRPVSKGSKTTSDTNASGKKPVGRPRGNAQERTVEEIAEAIEKKFNQFGAYLTIGLPVTGTYMVENSDQAVKALISIGKRRPKVMSALAKIADGGDGLDIAQYIAGIAVATQVDLGRVPADMILAKATGVTAVVEKYFVQEDDPANPNVTEQPTHATARFQTV